MATENINDDTLPEEAVGDLTASAKAKGTRTRRKGRNPAKSVTALKLWQKTKLIEGLKPYIERLPNEDGEVPEDPEEGMSRFTDRAMTRSKVLEILAPKLNFPITRHNISGVIDGFFGKLQEEPREYSMKMRGQGSEFEARLQEVEGKFAVYEGRFESIQERLSKALVQIHSTISALNTTTSTVDGQQKEFNKLSRVVAKLDAKVDRIDEEKASKLGTLPTQAAYSVTRDEAPIKSLADPRLKALAERRRERMSRFKPKE